jgi:hypothetical protein
MDDQYYCNFFIKKIWLQGREAMKVKLRPAWDTFHEFEVIVPTIAPTFGFGWNFNNIRLKLYIVFHGFWKAKFPDGGSREHSLLFRSKRKYHLLSTSQKASFTSLYKKFLFMSTAVISKLVFHEVTVQWYFPLLYIKKWAFPGGSGLGLSQFSILIHLPQKMLLYSEVVKIDPK